MKGKPPLAERLPCLAEELRRCAKCGSCLSVCPVHGELGTESSFARGKIACLEAGLSGDLELTDATAEVLSRCLLCGSCESHCPSGVRYRDIIFQARRVSAKTHFAKRIVLENLLPDERLPSFLRIGRAVQRLLARKDDGGDSMLQPRVRLPYLGKDRYLPEIPARFLTDGKEDPLYAAPDEKMRVGFFVGCATNFLLPAVGRSLIDLLRSRSISVVVPREQRCCGLPDAGGGLPDLSDALLRHNLRVFRDARVDRVVTACASCGSFLKERYDFRRDDGVRIPVCDASELLGDIFSPRDFERSGTGARVTYHDPCHLRKGQKLWKEPRALARAASCGGFVEMEEPEACCGFGGTFSLVHPDIALGINDRKMERIGATGAEVVLTSCPGCILFLKEGALRHGLPVRVRHVVEYLHERLHLKPPARARGQTRNTGEGRPLS
jgi:glycolate oxidase iron-sulfur subunit